MRTEPSFSEKPEEQLASNVAEHQEELDLSPEPDETSDVAQQLANYRQRYGLSVDPFADDQHFAFYTGGQRRQILDQLLHLCQFSNNVLVVLGGYSIGKTRMAQALIDSLDDADDICFLEGQVTSSFDSLMASVLAQFELPDIETLKEFFKRHSESDGLAVLLIDNAHHLIDEVLQQLIHLMGPETRVHIVFFAEPHLLPRLQALDIGDLALSDFGLMKFSLAETVDYLNFRMEMADYLGPELFTEANVESWWRQSRGQLLELHEYAQSKLLASSTASSKKVNYGKKGLPIPHVVGAAALGAILIMGLLYWSGESPSTKEAKTLTNIPLPQASAPSSVAASEPSAVPSSVAVETVQAQAATQLPVAAPAQHEAAPASAAASAIASAAVNSSIAAQAADTKVVQQDVVPLVQTNAAPQNPASKSVKASSVAAVKEVKKAEVEKAVAKKVDEPSAEKAKTVSAAGAYSEQERALLSWGESEFTLQLVGLSTEKAVNDFVAQQPNRKDLFVFKSLRQGKDWFVVVTGRYPSSAKARQAVALLPESQKAATPWPRDLKTIQKEIRSR